MEFALGFLRWTEAEFWNTSLRAWDRATTGYLKSKGVGIESRMTLKRLAELKAEFPDDPLPEPRPA